MVSLGFVVFAVLLASVAAAPAEDTKQSDLNTTSTENPKDAAVGCSFTDIALKVSMKYLRVLAEDGRYIESGAANVMYVLSDSTSGMFPHQIQKPLNQQAMQQAAKACNSVLNDHFVDDCKRPMKITECLSTEYKKITSKPISTSPNGGI